MVGFSQYFNLNYSPCTIARGREWINLSDKNENWGILHSHVLNIIKAACIQVLTKMPAAYVCQNSVWSTERNLISKNVHVRPVSVYIHLARPYFRSEQAIRELQYGVMWIWCQLEYAGIFCQKADSFALQDQLMAVLWIAKNLRTAFASSKITVKILVQQYHSCSVTSIVSWIHDKHTSFTQCICPWSWGNGKHSNWPFTIHHGFHAQTSIFIRNPT